MTRTEHNAPPSKMSRASVIKHSGDHVVLGRSLLGTAAIGRCAILQTLPDSTLALSVTIFYERKDDLALCLGIPEKSRVDAASCLTIA